MKNYLIYAFGVAFVCYCGNQVNAQQLFVPVGGNTWVLNNTEDKIDHTGIHLWQEHETILGTFFKLNKPGFVDVALIANVEQGKSKLKCWYNEQSYIIELSNTKKDTLSIGRFEIEKEGYLQINIQGQEKFARDFADISGLLISGSAVDSNTVMVKDDFYWGRRGPSVHLNYEIPNTVKDIVWFYNEITIPDGEDVIGSYFMANGFAEGYFGIQVNSEEERRVLFSVWSPYKTDDPGSIPEEYRIKMLAKGDGVHSGEFGNEGSGGQSYLRYMWQAGATYRFLLKGEPAENNSTDYTAYFYAPELNKWLLIASFRRPKTSTYIKRPHSFLENFVTQTGYISRKLLYTNQWVYDLSNSWHELTTATFTADATARKGARLDFSGGVLGKAFYLENCGFFNSTLTIDSKLTRQPGRIAPSIDFSTLPH